MSEAHAGDGPRLPGPDLRGILTSSGGDFTACWLSERLRVPPTRRRSICRWTQQTQRRAKTPPSCADASYT